jgi:hypothetical protein
MARPPSPGLGADPLEALFLPAAKTPTGTPGPGPDRKEYPWKFTKS